MNLDSDVAQIDKTYGTLDQRHRSEYEAVFRA